jgi:hypothetical protein
MPDRGNQKESRQLTTKFHIVPQTLAPPSFRFRVDVKENGGEPAHGRKSLFPFDRTPARTITIVTKGWLRRWGHRE